MTKDEALKLAMEAMEITGGFDVEINAIKEALAQPNPWEKFCDSNCVWTDHHPDCKLAEQHQDWCASLTQMLMSMPPKPAPCNCKPKPEPLPWIDKMVIDVPNQILYTAPQRTWVGLTFDERLKLAEDVDWAASAYCEYAEKIEAKLKERNT